MSNVAIDIQDSKVGNILAEDVFNKYGAILATEYTTLNSYIINKLYNFEIKKVKIFQPEYNCDNLDLSADTKKSYTQKVVLVKEIMNEIITKEKVNVKKNKKTF